MRRMDKEIKDPSKLRKILKETDFVTIAMCCGYEPSLVSLIHCYDEEKNCIYFHCASEGKKLDFLRSNPRVWGQALIDHGYHEANCSHLYVSAMFQGKVDFLEDLKEKKRAFRILITALDSDPDPLIKRLLDVQSQNASLEKTVVGRIKIEQITGKKSAEVEF